MFRSINKKPFFLVFAVALTWYGQINSMFFVGRFFISAGRKFLTNFYTKEDDLFISVKKEETEEKKTNLSEVFQLDPCERSSLSEVLAQISPMSFLRRFFISAGKRLFTNFSTENAENVEISLPTLISIAKNYESKDAFVGGPTFFAAEDSDDEIEMANDDEDLFPHEVDLSGLQEDVDLSDLKDEAPLLHFPFLDPCQQPPTEKTIRDVPDDCLCEILQFYANRAYGDESVVYGKDTSELRRVSKDFKRVIDSYPCYLTENGKHLFFLPFPFKDSYESHAWLNDKKMAKNFIKKVVQSAKGRNLHVNMKLQEKERGKFLSTYLKQFFLNLKENNHKLNFLKIEYHDAPGLITREEYKKKHQIKELFFAKKDVITNEELNMFGSVKKQLKVQSSKNFGTSKIKWPGTFKTLIIEDCNNFNLKYLQNLLHLKKLRLCGLDKVELKNAGLKSLELLSLGNCKSFNIEGLEKLNNLYKLEIDTYGELVGSLPKEISSINQLTLSEHDDYDCGEKFWGKFEKKGLTVLETAEKLKNLRKFDLRADGIDKFEEKQLVKAFKSLETIENNGCDLDLRYRLDKKFDEYKSKQISQS